MSSGELRYRSFSNRFLVDMFDNDAHPMANSRIVFSVSKVPMPTVNLTNCALSFEVGERISA